MAVSKILKIMLAMALPGLLGAQQFRIGEPAVGSPRTQGWAVDTGTGAMGISIPVGVVPGAIPIPVALTMNGSCTNYGIEQQFSIDHGIYGTVGFGCIGFSEGAGNFIVLEEGQRLSPSDFAVHSGIGDGLFAAFDVGMSSVGLPVTSDGKYMWGVCPTALLPHALSSLLPPAMGFPKPASAYYSPWRTNLMTGGNYHIIADKNRLRVFQEVAMPDGTYIAVPVLWKDRFKGWVKFTWELTTTGLPPGVTSIERVTAVNQQGLGVVVRWVNGPSLSIPTEMDLLRADFIGFSAPSLLVKGYPGSGTRPAGMVSTDFLNAWPIFQGGVVALPTEVTVAPYQSLPQPSWNNPNTIAQGPPQEGSLAGESRVWKFTYDKSSSQPSQILTLTDPGHVQTTFSYGPTAIQPGDLNQTLRVVHWGVTKAVQKDTSLRSNSSHTVSWTRTLPVTNGQSWTQPTWKVVVQDWWNNGDSTPSDRTETFTFASPATSTVDFNNGFLLSRVLTDGTVHSSLTQVSTSTGSLGAGFDGGLSKLSMSTLDRSGEPIVRKAFTYPGQSSFQVSDEQDSVFSNGAYATFLARHFTYADGWSLLGGQMVVNATSTRGSLPSTTVTNVWDTNLLQLQATFLNASASYQHGTTYSYDGDGRMASQGIWHLEGATTQATSPKITASYIYDPDNGQVNRVTTEYSDFTKSGASVTSTLGATSSQLDDGKRPTSLMGEDGVTTTYAYDVYGRPTSVERKGTPKVTITYDPWTITKTVNTTITTTHLDGFGRQLSQDLADGSYARYTYDLHGRLATTTRISSTGTPVSSTTTYDALNRPLVKVDFSGVQTSCQYTADGAGNNVVTRAFGTNTYPESTYTDPLGQVVKVVAANGDVTNRAYDNMGHVVRIEVVPSGGGSQVRTFTYDSLGRLIGKTEPETASQSFSAFNALNLPGTFTEAYGSALPRTRTLTWDGLGRLRQTGSTYNGMTVAQTSTYGGTQLTDASNAVTGTTSYTVTQKFTYGLPSSGGQLQTETTTQGGQDSTITYGYSQAWGILSDITYPSGRKVTYAFDSMGRVNEVLYNENGGTSTSIAQSTGATDFDGWGNRAFLKFASGATDQWGLDATGVRPGSWIVSPTTGAHPEWDYAYEATTGRLRSSGEWSFSPDNMGRLHYVTQAWGLAQDGAGGAMKVSGNQMSSYFDFDAFGNNVTSSATAGVVPLPPAMNPFALASLSSTNQLPASTASTPSGRINASYDTHGTGELVGVNTGVSSTTALSMAWDPLGRLGSVYQSPTGARENYQYAPSGLRVARVDTLDPVQNRVYGYTSGGQLLTEFSLPNAAKIFKNASSTTPTYAPTSSTHGGLQAARVWHVNGTQSCLYHVLSPAIAAGTTVTATVWVNAPAGTQGMVVLSDYTGNNNVASKQVTGTGAWQQVSVSEVVTATTTRIALYGNTNLTAPNGTFTLYDDLKVSTASGTVFSEDFESGISSAWGTAGKADVVTSSSATTFSGPGAVGINFCSTSTNSITRSLGYCAAGHTLTATVWVKAAVGVQAQVQLGYANPYPVSTTTVMGTGTWQPVTLSVSLTTSMPVGLTLTGKSDGTAGYTGYTYWDEAAVADSTDGLVFVDGFDSGLTSAWSKGTGVTADNVSNLYARDMVYLDGRVIAEIDATGVHELHSDHLGTPRIITSRATGAVEGIQTYGPYGELVAGTGYIPVTGYTGHVQTEPNGLIYMRARFYSPAWHRFLNSDPGDDPSQLNKYAYCGGNPMTRVDPTGTEDDDPPEWHEGEGYPNAPGAPHPFEDGGVGSGGGGGVDLEDQGVNSTIYRAIDPGTGESHYFDNRDDAIHYLQLHSSSDQSSQKLWFSTLEGDQYSDHWVIQWCLSQPSLRGGWIVQHISAVDGNGYITDDFWEAWEVPPGSTHTDRYPSDDDTFSGPRGIICLGAAQFYEGLTLPPTFGVGNVQAAGVLPSTSVDPKIPTAIGSPTVFRGWSH